MQRQRNSQHHGNRPSGREHNTSRRQSYQDQLQGTQYEREDRNDWRGGYGQDLDEGRVQTGSSFSDRGYDQGFESRGYRTQNDNNGRSENRRSYGDYDGRGDDQGRGQSMGRSRFSGYAAPEEGYGYGADFAGSNYDRDSDRSWSSTSGHEAAPYGTPRGMGRAYGYGNMESSGRNSRDMSDWGSAEGVRDFSRSQGQFSGRGPKGYRRSDERIKEEVSDALTADSHVDASEIDVSVSECVVTLKGTVENRRAKRMAEECVERVSGVVDVQNELRVQSSSNSLKSDEAASRTQGSRSSGKSTDSKSIQ